MSKISERYNPPPLSEKMMQTLLTKNIKALGEAISKGNRKFFNAAIKDFSNIIIEGEDLADASTQGKLLYRAKLNQLLSEAHKYRGICHMRLDQPEKALPDFTAAINYHKIYATNYDPILSKAGNPSPNYQYAHEERRACYEQLQLPMDAEADTLLISDLAKGLPYAPQLADFTPNWVNKSEFKQAMGKILPEPPATNADASAMQDITQNAPAECGSPLPSLESFYQPVSPTNFIRTILDRGSSPSSASSGKQR